MDNDRRRSFREMASVALMTGHSALRAARAWARDAEKMRDTTALEARHHQAARYAKLAEQAGNEIVELVKQLQTLDRKLPELDEWIDAVELVDAMREKASRARELEEDAWLAAYRARWGEIETVGKDT